MGNSWVRKNHFISINFKTMTGEFTVPVVFLFWTALTDLLQSSVLSLWILSLPVQAERQISDLVISWQKYFFPKNICCLRAFKNKSTAYGCQLSAVAAFRKFKVIKKA